MWNARFVISSFASLALLVTACDGETTPDSGTPPIDSGPRDAGRDSDAGVDAGTTRDAGTDAGATMDAGSTPDAGEDAGGGDDAGTDGGGSASCSPGLAVTADGSGTPALVISEIDPGSFIEVFNTTGADIVLATGTHQLCSPFTYVALATLAPTVIVPAGGYAELPWPSTFADTDAGGEIILYASGSFSVGTQILDFVCWGTNPHGSRMALATSSGKWSGACAGAISSGSSLARLPSTNGTQASHYDTGATPTPETCAP